MDNNELWEATLKRIEIETTEASFKTWFKDTLITKRTPDNIITVGAPNKMMRDWLFNKYSSLILKIIREIDDEVRNIEYVVAKTAQKRQNTIKKCIQSENQQLQMENLKVNRKDNLNPKYIFDSFVIGPFNQLAHAASQAVIQNPGITYNPLFVYGSTGHGKTHLIQAVGNHIKKTSEGAQKVYYVTSEQFARDYLDAIKAGKAHNFKDKYRQYDVLIIDDVQFIADKEKTQEELFHVFNSMHDNNKQIIFSSDQHPNYMPGLEDRMKGRFSAGMIVEIPKPDTDSRIEILKSKAMRSNIIIDEKYLEYIAKEVQGNIRELEGAFNSLLCRMQLDSTNKISTSELKGIVRHTTKPDTKISIKDLVQKVADYYEIDPQSIYEKTRKKQVVRPRQIIMYIMREDFGESFPNIGEGLGGRDHTTVIHSCDKIKRELEDNAILEQEISQIRSLLSG